MEQALALRIVELLEYEPRTGEFRWKRAPNKASASMVGKKAGWTDKVNGYNRVQVCGKSIGCNRLAFLFMMGRMPVGEVDHLNGNRADDRWENLREASHSVNQQNLRAAQKNNKSTGFLGAYKLPSGVFEAKIYHGGKQRRIGYFSTPEEAHAAYLAEKRKVHSGCTI